MEFAEFVVERANSEFELVSPDKKVPLYFIAIASNASIEATLPASIFVDSANELLNAKDQAIHELLESKKSQDTSLEWRAQQIADRDKSIEWLENEARKLERTLTAGDRSSQSMA